MAVAFGGVAACWANFDGLSGGGGSSGDAGVREAAVDAFVDMSTDSSSADGSRDGGLATSDGAIDSPSSLSSSDAGDAGNDAAVDANASCVGSVAIVSGSSSTLFMTTISGSTATPDTKTITNTVDGPYISVTADANGFYAAFDSSGVPQVVEYRGGTWSSSFFAPGGAADTYATPEIASDGTKLHLFVIGADAIYRDFYGEGQTWTSLTSFQKTGSRVGAAGALLDGTSFVAAVAGIGNDNGVYVEGFTTASMTWPASPTRLNANTGVSNPPLQLVALDGANDAMIVYASSSSSLPLQYLTRSQLGGWTAAEASIPMAFTGPGGFSLASTGNGGAVVSYLDASSMPKLVFFNGSTQSWGAPVALSGVATSHAPVLARGICGADAVMAYASTTTAVGISTITNGVVSAPSAISAAFGSTYIGIASRPTN